MYVMADNAIIKAPGTGLVQRYDFDQAQAQRMRGMGCGCAGLAGCPCGGKAGGLGLFESGLDPSGWAWPEMVIVGLGGYMVLSTLMTTPRAARRISGSVSGAYRGAKSGGRDAVGGGTRRKRYNPGRRARR